MTNFKRSSKLKYAIRAICLLLCAALLCAFIPACSKNDESEKCTLVIATDDDTAPHLEYVIAEFNEQSDKYKIVIESYATKGIKKYYLRSGVIEADMVTFIDYSDAAAFTDILQPLNLFKATGNYQSSIINNMRLADDNLYTLPSPGFLYSLCYNTDAFERLGLNGEPPSTYVSAIELAQKASTYGTEYAFCASSSTDEGLVNTFMAISTPAFVTTTKGVSFLKNYYNGTETLAGGSCVSEWKSVLQSFKDLYDTNYFSQTSNGAEDFVSGKSYAFYYSHDGSLQRALDKAEEKGEDVPNYKFYPFVSSQSDRTSIITNPYYYISVTKTAYQDTEKRAGLNEFLDYYTSSEGQYAAEMQQDGTQLEGCISFITDYDRQDEQFTGEYEPLKAAFESGRVFFADYFTSVFEGAGSLLRTYLNNEISKDNLLIALDEAVQSSRFADETYNVAETFEYDERSITSGETEIGDLAADAVCYCSSSKVVAAFVPSSCINASLLKGTVTASEIAEIFTDISLVRLQVTGAQLKQIALDNVTALSRQTAEETPPNGTESGEAPPEATDDGTKNGETPPEATGEENAAPNEQNDFLLMSGLYVSGDSVTFTAGQTISDGTPYWVALPQSVIEKYSLPTTSTVTVDLIDCLEAYLQNYSPVPSLDGRYGI